jgi:hypothetical protein
MARVPRCTESRRLLTGNWSIPSHLTGHECFSLCLLLNITMLSRAVLPLTRPNVLASAVRASALSARPSLYTAYKLSPGIQQRAKSTKSNKPKAPNSPEQNEFAAEQPEFDTKAEPKATEPSSTVSSYFHPDVIKDVPSDNSFISPKPKTSPRSLCPT